MKKYISNPVIIEAIQFDGSKAMATQLETLIEGSEKSWDEEEGDGSYWLDIPTLEGVVTAQAGDWVIRGTEGEYYPCKDSVFKRKYRERLPISKERMDTVLGPSIGEQIRNLEEND